jgi:hypothetical protein
MCIGSCKVLLDTLCTGDYNNTGKITVENITSIKTKSSQIKRIKKNKTIN